MLSYEMLVECEQRVLHSHQSLLVDAAASQTFLLHLHQHGLLSSHQLHSITNYGGVAGDKSVRLADELLGNKQFTLGLLCLIIQQDYPAVAEQLLQALSADTGAVEIEEELVHRHDTPSGPGQAPSPAQASGPSSGDSGGGQSGSAADKRGYGGASRRFTDSDRQLLSAVISTRSSVALETAREQVEYMTHEVTRLAERCDYVEGKLLEQTAKLGVFVRQNIELTGTEVSRGAGGASPPRDGRSGVGGAGGGRRPNVAIGAGRRTDAGVVTRGGGMSESGLDPVDDFTRFIGGNAGMQTENSMEGVESGVGPGVANWCGDEVVGGGFGGPDGVIRVTVGVGMRVGVGVGGVGLGVGVGVGLGVTRSGGIGTKNMRERAQEGRDPVGMNGEQGTRGADRRPGGPTMNGEMQAHKRASLTPITEENRINLAEEFEAKLSFIFSSFLISLREREYFWTRFEQVRKTVEARRVSWDVGRLLPKIQASSLEFSRAVEVNSNALDLNRRGGENFRLEDNRVDDWEQLVNEGEQGIRVIPSVTFQNEDGKELSEMRNKSRMREIDKSFALQSPTKSSLSLMPFGSMTGARSLGALGGERGARQRAPGNMVTATTQKRFSPVRLPTMSLSPGRKKNETDSPLGGKGQGRTSRK